MPMKDWFRRLRPLQLYIILVLTVLFFVTELLLSHITHSLTLLMDSYHTLCNIIALTGCIITMKYGKESASPQINEKIPTSSIEELALDPLGKKPAVPKTAKESPTRTNQENKLKNTFGWARVDIITMLVSCIFMASLSFSVFVEALQTLVHIDHLDEMHHPISVMCLGAAGLLLNGVCYLLIGGYTFHQGSFLYITESGDVVLNKVVSSDFVKQGGRRLSRTRTVPSPPNRQRQGFREMLLDTLGCVFVIICALIVYLTAKNVAKFVDPIISLLSMGSLMYLSFPYMKESCLILLQTIPDSINIDTLKKELLLKFPDIVNIHDFHVWQLTATKIISTIHVIFENHKEYNKLMDEIKDFLVENGITQVTIQPEFFTKGSSDAIAPVCLMQCQGEGCKLSHCCPQYEEKGTLFKRSSSSLCSKEASIERSVPDLKSVRVINHELSNEHVREHEHECEHEQSPATPSGIEAPTIEQSRV